MLASRRDLPLSPTQQGYLFDAAVQPADAYNVAAHLVVDPLDPIRLDGAVAVLQAEQPALRAAVRTVDDVPCYVIAESLPPRVQHEAGLSEAALEQFVEEFTSAPFQLDEAGLFRVAHVAGDDGDHLLVVCHHLVADGQSVGLLTHRLLALATAQELPQPNLDQGFSSYQEQQATPPQGRRAERAEAQWRTRLAPQEAPNLRHLLRGEPGMASGAAAELRFPVDQTLVAAARDAAQAAEVSLFTMYVSVFGVLLARYCATAQVSVATPFSDRSLLETESSVGCFIKTVPLLLQADPQRSVTDVLAANSREVVQTWKHLAYPGLVTLPEYRNFGAVADVCFIHDEYTEVPPYVRAVRRAGRPHFPGRLTILIEECGGATTLVVQFHQDALSRSAAELLAQRWCTLLDQMSRNVDGLVGDLELQSEPETAQQLQALSETHAADVHPAHLGELFLERTRRSPASVAWSARRRDYSHAWAHDAAVAVQRRLTDGTGPVGIVLERGPLLLAAVFGTALSDRPYVPLAADLPAARLFQILADAGVGAVLTQSSIALELPDGVRRIDVDGIPDVPAADEERNLIQLSPMPLPHDPDDTLYIEYTSGTTGAPKGVVVTHTNAHAAVTDLERRYPLRESDTFLLKTSFLFDIFGTEIYGWLVGAGRLALATAGAEGDPAALAADVAWFKVTHLNMTPTVLQALIDTVSSDPSPLHSLRYVLSGGEELPGSTVERFFALGLHASLENVYGPTEATMWATATTLFPGDSSFPVPIGTPLNDYRLYAIDPAGELCPPGIPGELLIAGIGVARGYLNRPDLTADRFVANPFYVPQTDPPCMSRAYRTGDLGVQRPDGRFAFLRRLDRQVKLGGVRLELGEIEAVLRSLPGVVQAAAILDDSAATPRVAACYTAREGCAPLDEVRRGLATQLPAALLPARLQRVETMPLAPSGKVDRRALLTSLDPAPAVRAPLGGDVLRRVAACWADVLSQPDLDPHRTFFEQGGTSLGLMRLQFALKTEFDRQLPITDLLSHPTIEQQATLLSGEKLSPDVTAHGLGGAPIAIVGIAVQTPGARDVHTFWENLRGGTESLTFYTDAELSALGVSAAEYGDPAYVPAGGPLAGINEFDDVVFGLSPAEVDATAPQLRLLYQLFWHACEDAGYDPRALPGRVGVYVGASDDFGWYQRALGDSFSGDSYQRFTLATNHFFSTRLSYAFNLTGPSLSALAGCSTSLLTVHLAVQALRQGECDLAMAGGVTVELPNAGGYRYLDGMMLSPDGHCRPFDAGANGTVFSNGGALLLLKPLAAAQADGDPIYAVIKGTAARNDGSRKLSYTAPSEDGQYETICAALANAGIDATDVSYVEAHGTGTLLGDPVEVAALTRAFEGAAPQSCTLGSVKGNIGHTDSAAGAVGLSKVALSLHHGYQAGTCNYASANPNIDFEATPFRVASSGQDWRAARRYAGINSFGVGGTNVHAVLESAPPLPPTQASGPALLQFAAATPTAVARTAERVLRHLADHPELSLHDAATTLRRGRAPLPYRCSVVVTESNRDALPADAGLATSRAGRPPRIAFAFPGQGNQYPAMARGLAGSDAPLGRAFRHHVGAVLAHLGRDEAEQFEQVWSGVDGGRGIHRTEWSQLALFATQYAMAQVLHDLGVQPDVLVGHSIGELTAATLAGVWELGDAVRLVRSRGLLMQAQEPGVMVAVTASADRIRQIIAGLPDVWIALSNSPRRCVLGMRASALDPVLDRLEAADIRGMRLQTSHAFHTPMMQSAADEFTAVVATVASSEPTLSIISNADGRLVGPGLMTAPAYWGSHIINPVNFSACLHTLLADGPLLTVETGPGRSVATFAGQDPGFSADHTFVSMLKDGVSDADDVEHALASLGTLWSYGVELDPGLLGAGHRISLPGYQFDPVPHPVEGNVTAPGPVAPLPAPVTDLDPTARLATVQEAFHYVLGYDAAPDADFFGLGGDSLKATALVARLSQRLGHDITVADVFAHPTAAGLAALQASAPDAATLPAAQPAVDYPLTAAQRRIFLAAQLDPSDLTYNMTSATILDGHLDPARTREALAALVARHEPLRTQFRWRDGEVRQHIVPAVAAERLPLAFSTLPGAEWDIESLVEGFLRPFDLSAAPLFRMEIVSAGARSILLFDVHHIIGDATAVEILTRDFSALYAGSLPPLSRQFKDYAVQADADESGVTALAASLAGSPTTEVLALDHARGQRTRRAGRVTARLTADQTTAVHELARRHETTVYTILLASWAATVARYGDTEDIVIGMPVTGRTLPETQEMIGMFVNMVPVRLRPEQSQPLDDFLQAAREQVRLGLEHQDAPFDEVVGAVGGARASGRHPLLDMSFDHHNISHHDLAIDGIAVTPVDLAPRGMGMDVVVTSRELDGYLDLTVDFAADLYDESTLAALTRSFVAFVEAAVADEHQPLGAVSIMAPRDSAALIAGLDDEVLAPIQLEIAERAAARPDGIAVIGPDGGRLTYGDLDRLADRQAARLIRAGLSLGEPVALVGSRETALFVAQLGILKAGGHYVPLDPNQPVERHRAIIADVAPRFAFAPPSWAAADLVAQVLDLEGVMSGEEDPTPCPAVPVTSETPAYAIYTSGSTGSPKGITIPHRGVSNLLRDHRERGLFGPGDTVVALADPSFDIFVFESLLPLACGATVHLCPQAERHDAAAIARRIAQFGITHLQAPVSKLAALCGNDRFRAALRALRVVVGGGEHFSSSLRDEVAALTDARIFNMYGPTEATVTSTVKELDVHGPVTIGSPVRGAAAFVVNALGRLQPDGAPGELCIAGPGLALGYLNNPADTHRAFTSLAELPGLRVYHTGDVATRRRNGEFTLAGRLDHQVKLHGNRIELGEIEQTAMRVDGVSFAVAAVDNDDLILAYTADDGTDHDPALRAALAATLPVSMQPQLIQRLGDVPRLPNDKADRRATVAAARAARPLPVAPTATAPANSGATATTGGLLAQIQDAWAAELGRRVGPDDNFFEVGGTSYKLMMVANRLNAATGREIPLVRLFEHPTPGSLAGALGEPPARQTLDQSTNGGFGLAELTSLGLGATPAVPPASEHLPDHRIAVIGVAGVFPGAGDVPTFWRHRREGVVSIDRFTTAQLTAAGIDPQVAADPHYVNARGCVAADTFDPDFFGYSVAEATLLDPQVRLLHEVAWHALEDAGYIPTETPGRIAVFAGSGSNFAWTAAQLRRHADSVGVFEAQTANEKDFLATKLAYKLDLTGPALTVQTACSTSLVAVHEAVRCLRAGEAELALAGGVALNFPRAEGYAWHDGMIFSPDGVCRPFSDDAAGTVPGQGCGVVVLKPLATAVADGDHVYAVISGTAVNNDGALKVGYTAPSVQGQRAVIEAALADARMDAGEVGYVETHGTGTKLGDPIEYEALQTTYGSSLPCALGATKANLGHLDAAAGVAGLISAVGVLADQVVPPVANFGALNQQITAAGALYVPTTPTRPAGGIRAAAVSAFGIGGTNAHVVLTAAPPAVPTPTAVDTCLLPLSARRADSLALMRADLEEALLAGVSPVDAAFTLARGRGEYAARAVAVVSAPGRLCWLEGGVVTDASDDITLRLDPAVLNCADEACERLQAGLDAALAGLAADLGAAVRAALCAPTSEPSVGLLAQVVARAALTQLVDLGAGPGNDRLLTAARALLQRPHEVAAALAALLATPPAAAMRSTCVDAAALRQGLAERWLSGAPIPRTAFTPGEGRRVSLPGYRFAAQPLPSDVRYDELFVAPGDSSSAQTAACDVRTALAAIWTEVLGVDPQDASVFLRAGGDSLSAVRFAALAQERCQARIPVTALLSDKRFEDIVALATLQDPAPALIAPAAEPVLIPASPAQRRVFAICSLQPDSHAYNLAQVYRVHGALDVARLRRSLAELVARHEQLRTSFTFADGVLMQCIEPAVPDVLTVTELSADSAAERLRHPARGFDLARAPLFCAELLDVADGSRYLVLDLHHTIGDQTSLGVLADELGRLMAGQPLPPAPLPYSSYVAARDEHERAGGFDADVAAVVDQLGECPPRLELPVDHPHDASSGPARRHGFTASVHPQRLRAAATAQGATPFAAALAACTRLFGLWSGQADFTIGTALSGRTFPGTQSTVGMFVNTLPLRLHDDGARTVGEAISAASQMSVAALTHQGADLEAVSRAVGVTPRDGTAPLFGVVVNYVAVGTEDLELPGVCLEPVEPETFDSRYDVTLALVEHPDRLDVEVEYRTDLFDRWTIARIADHLDHLLSAMAGPDDCRLDAVALTDPETHAAERALLDGATPAVPPDLVAALHASCVSNADRPALRFHGEGWSYRDLDRITDRLAGGLQQAGVAAGDFVVCLLTRSPWQVFSRLALLKCGAVEVPVDAAAPAARVDTILADTGARVLLAGDDTVWLAAPGIARLDPAHLDGTFRAPAGRTLDDPVIMIYTSGTTGTPKGSLLTSRCVLSMAYANGYVTVRPGDRFLHVGPYTFDPSIFDVYSALLGGATLVMADAGVARDAQELGDFLEREQIDQGLLITSVFHLLMNERPEAVRGLRALYVGGEVLQPWAAQRAFDEMGPGRLFNGYGPTESTVFSTWYRIDERPGADPLPIGRACHHRRLFVVHPDGTPLPAGIPGELWIAGAGVAAGYHNRPELTATKFPRSLAGMTDHYYRTGDKVVQDPEGELRFLGRLDRQVKHFGYRIELGEIEDALQRVPGVTAVAVVHTEDAQGRSLLAGFYAGEPVDTDEVRRRLEASLPRFMVPQRFHHVARMPLTRNGKVDSAALAELLATAPATLPATSDDLVLDVIRRTLHQPDLAADTNLFEAGGQSIQAIAIAQELRGRGFELRVSDVYRHPSAAALTAALRPVAPVTGSDGGPRSASADPATSVVAACEAAADRSRACCGPVVATLPAGPAAALHNAGAAPNGACVHRLRADDAALRAGLRRLVARHEALRLTLHGDEFALLDADAVTAVADTIPVLDLRDGHAADLGADLSGAAQRMLDWPFTDGLLWRVVAVRDTDSTVRLAWSFHHSIFDARSADVLGADLQALCEGAELAPVDGFASFLTASSAVDWNLERSEFDLGGWLAAVDATTRAAGACAAAVGPQPRATPLRTGEHPLLAALDSVAADLAAAGSEPAAVAFVGDCRRLGGRDFTGSIGEFLDAVPVWLRPEAPPPAERLAAVQQRGVHHLRALSDYTGDDPLLLELRERYLTPTGRFQLVVVNVQGYLAPGDVPRFDPDAALAPIAAVQLNLWFDDDAWYQHWLVAGEAPRLELTPGARHV